MDLNTALAPYLNIIDKEIQKVKGDRSVAFFYEPIEYVIGLQGKRIRPLLTVLIGEVFGAGAAITRFPAAAVELLHNFTLVHDDIMDNDALRRGHPTVHTKWDISAAILSGDGLMGLAFRKLLENPRGNIKQMASRFTEAMIVICEGQGLDKMFEREKSITFANYMDMIARKTAALIELSCELGAMTAEVSDSEVKTAKHIGYALGMGFQIQDDLLDVTAEEERLGKKVGSDLAMHKRNLITLLLEQKLGDESFYKLDIDAFRHLIDETGVLQEVTSQYKSYFKTACEELQKLPANSARDLLNNLIDYIQWRDL